MLPPSPPSVNCQLFKAYGEQQVQFWYREFKNSRTGVYGEQRSERPSLSDAVVAKLEAIMREDYRSRSVILFYVVQWYSQIPSTKLWPKNWATRTCAPGGCYTCSQLITSHSALIFLGSANNAEESFNSILQAMKRGATTKESKTSPVTLEQQNWNTRNPEKKWWFFETEKGLAYQLSKSQDHY